MKFPPVMILSMVSFLILLLPLLVVESSSLNHTTSSVRNEKTNTSSLSNSLNQTSSQSTFVDDTSSSINGTRGAYISPSLDYPSFITNITRGSSISTFWNLSSSRWLSPSGNLAFGFCRLRCPDSSADCPDQYGLGVYIVKSPYTTLVWTTNRYYDKPSLVLFTNKGKLVLRSLPDYKEEPLIPTIQEPISYAMMLDSGNFVLYGNLSQIIWQSFDYPTDTILASQSLRSGVDLISGGSRLSIQEMNGAVTIYTKTSKSVISDAVDGSLMRPVILSLNTAGQLYLVGSDGIVLKYLHQNKNLQREGSTVEEGVHMYRARLDSTGHFRLYKERIDGNVGDHEEYSVLVQSWPVYHLSFLEKCLFAVLALGGFVALIVCFACCSTCCAMLYVGFAALCLLLALLHICRIL